MKKFILASLTAMLSYLSLGAVKSIEDTTAFDNDLAASPLLVAYLYRKGHEIRDEKLSETMHDFERLETNESSVVNFVKVNIDRPHLQELTTRYSVAHTPAFILFKNGSEVTRVSGCNPNGTLRELTRIMHDIRSAIETNFAQTIKTLEEAAIRQQKLEYYSAPRVNPAWDLYWGWPYWGAAWYPYWGWGWSCW